MKDFNVEDSILELIVLTFLPLNHGTKGFDVPPKHATRASSKRIYILIRDVYTIGQ